MNTQQSAEERAQATRALIKQHLPEAVPFIRELHQLGMIDGWRNVHSFRLITEGSKP